MQFFRGWVKAINNVAGCTIFIYKVNILPKRGYATIAN